MRGVGLLRSKLRRPALPGDLIPRPRLNDALAAAVNLPLTVVLAPVGFGKTTAAALWSAQTPLPTAWLSLDEQDADPVRLFRHLVAALRTAHPGFGDGLDALLLLPEVPRGAALGEALADALNDIPERTALVIDDAHLAAGPEAVALMKALVRYPAPDVPLVLVTRSAAMVDLGKLQAHAKAASIDAAMLRFSMDETVEFLSSHGVAADTAQGLEGWPAGLRLSVMAAMAGGAPAAREQAGVVSRELLMEAALEQTPPDHLEPLLVAAAVERISGELCAAITGQPARALELREALNILAVDHAFLAPKDGAGEWFAVEPLFREALLDRARAVHGEAWIAAARLSASDWFEARGDVDTAITHALLAKDVDRAARLVEDHAFERAASLEFAQLETWLARLPEATVRERPHLLLARASCQSMRGAIGSAVAALDRAEALLASVPASERATLLARILVLRSEIGVTGTMDLGPALAMFEQALALLPEGECLGWGTEIHVPAMAALTQGDPERAIAGIEAWARERRPPNDAYATAIPMTEAAIHLLDGNPTKAAAAAVRLCEVARKVNQVSRQTWAAALEANALLAMNALPEAEAAFDRYQDLAYNGLMNFVPYQDTLFGRGLLLHLTGRGDEAADMADRYIRLLGRSANPELLTLARSFRARLAALEGDAGMAMAMLASIPEPTGRQALSMVESLPLTRARVLATQGEPSGLRKAVDICSQMRGRALRSVDVRARVIQAWAQEALGEPAAAENALAEALALGVGRGLLQPFAQDGERILPILRRLETAGDVDALLALALVLAGADADAGADGAAVNAAGRSARAAVAEHAPAAGTQPVTVDDLMLTRRELEVLHALRRGLTNKQIADELFIAPATVKRHMTSLFRKLGVTTRTQAVLHPQSVEIFRRSV
jgi:LuxR family maltose regulon positive regulatory protein